MSGKGQNKSNITREEIIRQNVSRRSRDYLLSTEMKWRDISSQSWIRYLQLKKIVVDLAETLLHETTTLPK